MGDVVLDGELEGNGYRGVLMSISTDRWEEYRRWWYRYIEMGNP